jgi:hypothetical protein
MIWVYGTKIFFQKSSKHIKMTKKYLSAVISRIITWNIIIGGAAVLIVNSTSSLGSIEFNI